MAKEIIAVEMGADGKYSAYTTTLKSVIIGSGDTAEEAIADFKNSLSEVIEYCRESAKEVHEELQGLSFEYRYLPSDTL